MNRVTKIISTRFLLIFSLFLLVGCAKKVTIEDLKENDWIMEYSADEESSMIASFSDKTVTMKVDTSGMESSAENEWEELGEEFAKSLIDLIEMKLEYTLDGKNITIEDPESDKDSTFVVSRKDKNIIFTPTEGNKDEILTLSPLKKDDSNKKKKAEKTEETAPEDIAEFNDGTLSSKDFTLDLKESTLIQSPSESKPGLYVTFELTNHSEEPISPIDILDSSVSFEQTTDTSLVTLQDNYFFLDAFGSSEDIDSYNEQVERSNANSDRLLPGKTITIYQAYSLKDGTSPVTMVATVDHKEISPFEIELAKIKKIEIVEPKSTQESIYFDDFSIEESVDFIEDDAQLFEPTPEPEAPVEPDSNIAEYTEVLTGETPNEIAARAGVSVDELFRLNGMSPDNYFITPGQQLRIK